MTNVRLVMGNKRKVNFVVVPKKPDMVLLANDGSTHKNDKSVAERNEKILKEKIENNKNKLRGSKKW